MAQRSCWAGGCAPSAQIWCASALSTRSANSLRGDGNEGSPRCSWRLRQAVSSFFELLLVQPTGLTNAQVSILPHAPDFGAPDAPDRDDRLLAAPADARRPAGRRLYTIAERSRRSTASREAHLMKITHQLGLQRASSRRCVAGSGMRLARDGGADQARRRNAPWARRDGGCCHPATFRIAHGRCKLHRHVARQPDGLLWRTSTATLARHPRAGTGGARRLQPVVFRATRRAFKKLRRRILVGRAGSKQRQKLDWEAGAGLESTPLFHVQAASDGATLSIQAQMALGNQGFNQSSPQLGLMAMPAPRIPGAVRRSAAAQPSLRPPVRSRRRSCACRRRGSEDCRRGRVHARVLDHLLHGGVARGFNPPLDPREGPPLSSAVA